MNVQTTASRSNDEFLLPRIISLIPSGTEIIHALGMSQYLVGRSHECDFPAQIAQLPICCRPRIDIHAGSAEIDRQVRESLKNSLSIYEVDVTELNRLRPTHVVTQALCEVCAVSLEEVQHALCQVVDSKPTIISHNPTSLEQLWDDIRDTALLLGVEVKGNELVDRLQQELQLIQQSIPADRTSPRVLCLEWLDPLMTAGNWVPELVAIAGGTPLLCEAGAHSPEISWDLLIDSDPDIIIVMPCGFGMERSRRELALIQSHPRWGELRAVRNKNIFVTDGNQYFNRPGPRLVDSAEILREILWCSGAGSAELKHCGTGWTSV